MAFISVSFWSKNFIDFIMDNFALLGLYNRRFFLKQENVFSLVGGCYYVICNLNLSVQENVFSWFEKYTFYGSE